MVLESAMEWAVRTDWALQTAGSVALFFALTFFETGAIRGGKGGEGGGGPAQANGARRGGIREFLESTARKAVKVEKAVAGRECLAQAGAANTAFTGIAAFGLTGCEMS